ncbi:hypothetical protein [Streptomyces sp. SP18CS02]|uniref:hypothetical protein n=1 Tax=Streptomyces sp. SP18CS02 TaxID=3002531 RepID=UPI002E78DE24|nr:hypothetical protein [Streptomyces sp. SP18CS02]MEE1757225.1 hypothetical protein [Streptomyces sp. SP18CS02]
MTTPSQPPPGPYPPGSQPPGPYGSPQPGYPQAGYPRSGQPGYHPPQYPGGGAGPGPYGGWGQPPLGPPPKKKRTGLVIGIVAGSLALVAVLAWAGKQGLDAASGAGGSFPAAEFRLTTPKTLLSGEYKLLTDTSEEDRKEVEEEGRKDPSIRDAKAVIAQYEGKGGSVLVVSGFHGRLKDPDGTRRAILDGASTGEGTTLVVPPKDFEPAGAGVKVSCQVTRSQDAGTTSTLPMCAWGDGNTASFVAIVTPEIAEQKPEEVDLAALADSTAKVRAEMRAPIG